MNKTRRCTGRLCAIHPVEIYIYNLKILLFFHPIRNFPLQSFWEPIRPKCDNKMVNESSKKQSAPRPREKIFTRHIRPRTKNHTPYQSNSNPRRFRAYRPTSHPVPPNQPNRLGTTYAHSPDLLSGGRIRPVSLPT